MEGRDDLPARLARRDRMMQTFGIELIAARPGACELQLTVTAEHLNAHGTCHGAVLYALADCAFAFSCNAYGTVAVGIDTHMSFSLAANEGDRVRAVAEEVARSRRLATYHVRIARHDTVIATFTGTAYITSRAHDEEPRL